VSHKVLQQDFLCCKKQTYYSITVEFTVRMIFCDTLLCHQVGCHWRLFILSSVTMLIL